jgi:hypothetical protein
LFDPPDFATSRLVMASRNGVGLHGKKLANVSRTIRLQDVTGTLSQNRCRKFRFHQLRLLFCGWVIMTAAGTALANTLITTDSPVGFFTNVASRLLSAELNVDLHHIQIYPTNQYTPAVHRLLQVTANIYDATTNRYNDDYPHLPTVFRPVFDVEKTPAGTNVYICDFSEVTNAYEADAPMSVPYDLANPAVLSFVAPGIHSGGTALNVFGAPWIIGAKKGFPNFNEFYMENAFQLMRRVMVTRQSTNVPAPVPTPTSGFFNFYEMFNLSLNNQFGVECWNSYRSNYTRPIDIYVTNFMVVTLTNDENNFSFTTNLVAGSSLSFGPSIITNLLWPGYTNSINPVLSAGSFQIPLEANFAAIPVSMYRFNGGAPFLTTNLALPFEMSVGQYPQPHWGLTVTNNLQVVMVDHDSGRIIDYVPLSGPNSSRDLFAEIQRGYDTLGTGNNTGYNDLWDTNLFNAFPLGFAEQFGVSQGKGNPIWSQYLWGDEKAAYDSINAFRVFSMGSSALILTYVGYTPDKNVIGAAEMTNAMQMPYTPSAMVVQDIVWQANDPLVHYMASDLNNPTAGSGLQIYTNWPGNLGRLNQRYQPWGGNPGKEVGTNLLAIKDPLVTCSDDWDFPISQPLDISWLGRIHRGTPWQTVYLKAPDVLSYPNNFGSYGFGGPNLWVNWTGNQNSLDATNTAPRGDWHVASLLAGLFNTNDFRSLLSVNNPDPDAWQGLLDGLTALTNNLADVQLQSLIPPQFGVIVISSNSTQASVIANAIESARAGQPNQFFNQVGDVLGVPQLNVNSPFLNWNDSVQLRWGISDEAYEIIPSQLLSLLRADSVGSVTSANGQMVFQFTGYDGHCYAIEVSSNLVDWASISTNSPTGGAFNFTNLPTLNANQQYYRSVLLN